MRPEIGVGGLLVVALGLFAYMAIQVGGGSMFFDTKTYVATFEDASGLQVGAPVTVAGVRVGQIDDIGIANNRARVTIEVANDLVLYKNSTLTVLSRSLLGEKYLSILVGNADSGVLGPSEQISQTFTPLDLTTLVNRIEPFLDASKPEDIAEIVASIRTVVASVAKDPDRLDRIMENLDELAASMSEVSSQLPQTLERTDGAIRRVARAADSTRNTAVEVDNFVSSTKPVVMQTMDDMQVALDSVNTVILDWNGAGKDVALLLEKLSNIERADLVDILREEGILIRLKEREVKE